MFQRNKLNIYLLIGLTVLLLLPAAMMPLMESTEARYAEIAREMVTSGNYLEPHFNAIKHFHKPPLSYWLVASGFKIFGLNNFGARFFGILAAVLAVVFLYRTTILFLPKNENRLVACFIFSSSLLFLVVSRLASTEIYLLTSVIAAQYYLFNQIFGAKNWKNALWYGIWLGLGFMIKGPIIFLFTLLPALIGKIIDKRHRKIFRRNEIILAVGIFALLALPWYFLVNSKNPGLLEYFFKVQTVNRVITDRFHRYKPPWYFFYIFAATFFPSTLFFLKGLGQWKKFPEHTKTMFLYIVVPFSIFTLAESKHGTYILPLYGTCAIVTAEMLARDEMPRLRALTTGILAIFALAPAVAGFAYPPLRHYSAWLICIAIILLLGWWQVWSSRKTNALWGRTTLFMLAFCCVVFWIAGLSGPQMHGYQQMSSAINQRDPQKKLEVLVYHGFLPSVSFYRNRLAVMAFPGRKETRFQSKESYQPWCLKDEQEVGDFLSRNSQLFVIVRKQQIDEFTAKHPYACEPVFLQRKHSLYLCNSKPQPPSSPDRYHE